MAGAHQSRWPRDKRSLDTKPRFGSSQVRTVREAAIGKLEEISASLQLATAALEKLQV